MIMDINKLYTAHTSEGYELQLVISEYTNMVWATSEEPIIYKCYDENYTSYSFACNNVNALENGDILYEGTLVDEYNFECHAVLSEYKTPLYINMHSELCVLRSNGNYILWDCLYSHELRKLCNDDSGRIKCKALNMKKLKTTGNYKVIMNMEGEGYSRDFIILMDEHGTIVKSAEIFE